MIRLLAKLARAVGVVLLAVLAIWFLPVWLFGKCGSPGRGPESAEPEYLHYQRLKAEKRKRWLLYRVFRKWEQKDKEDRWERIEKMRNNFFS